MKTYSEKLKDPRWQKKRLEVLQRDDFCCLRCLDSESTLAVHHLFYIRGRNPWEYPMWSLETLCESCHDDEHSAPEAEDEKIGTEWEAMIGFIFGDQITDGTGHHWDLAVECGMLASDIGRVEFEKWLLHAANAERLRRENRAVLDSATTDKPPHLTPTPKPATTDP